ncbi:MAG: histidine--tRNA ligase [Anaerolineales bacterium]
MSKLKAKTPKGMRDFLPAEMLKRQYVFGIVREVFESFGFEPISTPVMELRTTLMGNYGEDAEKLIYHAQHTQGKEELALRYDLTVPLSRFFAEHENALSVPFRRYHIAPVWRGERPGRGRYREFTQCDADIVGVRGVAADAECLAVVYTALTRLGFRAFQVKLNHRGLLLSLAAYAGVPAAQQGGLYRIIDKTDKIGLDGVAKELANEGLPDAVITALVDLLGYEAADNAEHLAHLRALLGQEAAPALDELADLLRYTEALGVPPGIIALDLSMVRGLGYYTGPIYETIITEPENLGSVQGGGRYDDLIGLFRFQSLPTTGISLGIERIIDLMDQLDLYPPEVSGTVVQVMVAAFDSDTLPETLRLAHELRAAGWRAEAYLDERKNFGKQLGYAEGRGIPIVAMLGPDELAAGQVTLRYLPTRDETTVPRASISEQLRAWLAP